MTEKKRGLRLRGATGILGRPGGSRQPRIFRGLRLRGATGILGRLGGSGQPRIFRGLRLRGATDILGRPGGAANRASSAALASAAPMRLEPVRDLGMTVLRVSQPPSKMPTRHAASKNINVSR